jgi:predicted deacylase
VNGQIAGLKPAPGTAAEGKLVVPAGVDPAIEIPITVIHGSKPGPTLAVIAGLSGAEYGPIAASLAFVNGLKPAELSGTVAVVHTANMPGFTGRSSILNPIDHKDLSRTFPGKADGTSCERIAFALVSELIEKADYVVSLQSGGANKMVQPYVEQTTSGNAKLDSKSSAMALAFGINFIVVESSSKHPGALSNAAVAHGKPVITIMNGALGVADNRSVESMARGLASLMNSLEMTTGPVTRTRSPVFFDQTVSLDSPSTGLLVLYAQRGQEVHKGDPLCGVENYFAKNLKVLNSPADGIILSIVSTIPVEKGETIVLIGVPRE